MLVVMLPAVVAISGIACLLKQVVVRDVSNSVCAIVPYDAVKAVEVAAVVVVGVDIFVGGDDVNGMGMVDIADVRVERETAIGRMGVLVPMVVFRLFLQVVKLVEGVVFRCPSVVRCGNIIPQHVAEYLDATLELAVDGETLALAEGIRERRVERVEDHQMSKE